MRILLYTGKGGVGKTTVAGATALRCAELGRRTLVISTDPAHSLADAFDLPLGPEPTAVAESLWGQEINVLEEIDAHWGEVRDYLAALFAARGMEDVAAEEMAVFPGIEELCSLLQVREQAKAGRFACLIVDCAPTGETLRLLSFPDAARWYMEKLFPWERRIITAVGPVVQPFLDIPIPRDNVFATLEILFHRVAEVKKLLADPETSTVRLVLNPEKMVIKEAQRALTYLSLYGYATDAIISNRVLPAGASGAFVAGWRSVQARYRRVIRDAFHPLPVWEVPLFEQEVVGLSALARMAEDLFGDRDPMGVYFAGPLQRVERTPGGYRLRLPLPFLEKGDVSLLKRGNELAISIGNFRRDIFLPTAIAEMEATGATLRGGELWVSFAGDRRRSDAQEARRKGKTGEPRAAAGVGLSRDLGAG